MELVYIARAARRYWWVIVAAVALGVAAGVALGSSSGAQYEATALLLITPGSSGGGGDRYVQNELVILSSGTVAAEAASSLDQMSQADVSDAISIVQIPDTDIVSVTGVASTPARAQALTNAYADAYIDLAAERLHSGRAPELENLNSAIDELGTRLGEVDAQIARVMAPFLDNPAGIIVPDIEQVSPTLATERDVLRQQYSQLIFTRNEIELGGEERLGSTVTDYAAIPRIPVATSSKLLVAVGLTAGLVFGTLGAVVIARLSGRILDAEEATGVLQAPVAATIPRSSALARHPILIGEPLPDALAEGVGELAVQAETSIPPGESGRGALVVLVAGTEDRAGATTLAVALATHFAEKGSQVLLVDADVAHPELSAALGEGVSGVRMLLSSRAEPSPSGRSQRGVSRTPYSRTAVNGLRFAGLGEQPIGQALRRQEIPLLLDAAAAHAQVVVIDGGTLMDSASSVQLAQLADAVVLSMPLGRQSRAGLETVKRPLAARRGDLLPVMIGAGGRRSAGHARSVSRPTGETVDDPDDDAVRSHAGS